MAAIDDAPAPADVGLDPARASRSLTHGLISLGLLVALVLGLLLAVPGLHGVLHTVERMPEGWVLAAIALEVLSCLGYVLAFLQVFDRAPIRFGARVALSELAFGAAVSVGGAGSVAIGAWLLVERGGPPARIAQRSAVLFLLTSAVNVLTLAATGLALALGILPGPSNVLLGLVPGLVGVAVFAFFLALPALLERRTDGRPEGRITAGLMATAASIRITRQMLLSHDWRLLGAVGYLWFDIGVLAACFAATGHTPTLSVLVLAYQIGYIANLVPIPGGIGVLDGSLVGMFALYGVNVTAATAATVVYHAIALWIPAMWGTTAYVILRRTKDRPITLRPPLEERRRLRAERRARTQ
jgi:uncharacterized membrane protein YbhN (UPF0104 family)